MKEIGNSVILSIDAVDEVFVFASDINLASDCNFIVWVVAHRRIILVAIIENDWDCSSSDAGLSALYFKQ